MLLGLKNSADIEKEVKILTTLQHPHIRRLLDFYDEEEHYFMVLELVSGGDLFDRVVHLSGMMIPEKVGSPGPGLCTWKAST